MVLVLALASVLGKGKGRELRPPFKSTQYNYLRDSHDIIMGRTPEEVKCESLWHTPQQLIPETPPDFPSL